LDNNPIILYIEDNADNRMLVRRVLMAEDFDVVECSDGPSGITWAEQHTPALILMDINLPEIDGLAVTARLRDMPHLRRVPIIALTANVMKGDREKTLAAGCTGFIAKPIDIDTLPRQLRRFIVEAAAA
jgi:two-component system cell cycle response regulator DivK